MNLEQNKQQQQIKLQTMPQPYLNSLDGEGGITLVNNVEIPNENIITLIAGEDILAGQVVCLQKNDNTEDTGKCLVQCCNKEEDLDTKGIALNDAETGEICTIQIRGILDINFNVANAEEFRELKAGTTLYCGENGELVDKIILREITNYIIIGKMIEPTKLLIDIQQYKMARRKK